MEYLTSLSDALASSSLTEWLTTHEWAVPLLQSIHIMSVAIVLSSIALLDLRLAGLLGRGQSLRDLTLRFYPWIWGALLVLIGTGILQVMAEPARELLNFLFWSKMGLIITAVLFTMPVRRLLEDRPFQDLPSSKRHTLRLCAFVSLTLWALVIVCGRWIAYAGDMTA